MVNPRKIFIFCVTGIGNIILFLPAYKALKSKYPGASITLALDLQLYDDAFIKDQFGSDIQVVKFPHRFKNFLNLLKIIKRLRKEKFDLAMMPHCGPSWKLNLFLLLVGADRTVYFRSGIDLIDRKIDVCLPVIEGEHYLNRNLDLVKSLGASAGFHDGAWIALQDKEEQHNHIKRNDTIIIGLHPGVNEEFNNSRRWPAEYFRELIGLSTELDKKVDIIIFGTSREKNLIDEICNEKKNCIKIIDKSLVDVSRYILQCNLFIGNDSGIMNLSVSLGIPTLGILGPTNPKHTGPYGNKHRIARLNLPCSPCFDKGYSLKCKHRRCLIDLTPNIVWSIAKDMLIKENKMS